MDNVNRCVVCGEIIPEGRQVCPQCESDPVNRPAHYTDGKIEVIDFIEDKKNSVFAWVMLLSTSVEPVKRILQKRSRILKRLSGISRDVLKN